jgi:RsiW-degrading membrane proteinase PrsW (M82 family)
LILGALAGLGFAFTENFFYAVIYPTAPVVRAIIPPLGHICDSAIAAIGIALISQKNIHRPLTDLRSILLAINTKETRTFFIIAMSFHALNNLILTVIEAPFSTVFWVANLIAGYLVLYKLYTYLPEKLNKIKLSGPISLITEAIHFNRKEDQKAFKTN